jgi:hypothetical protein
MLLRSPALAVAATLAFAAAASAQVGTFYTFSQSVGTYVPVTGGTIISTATSANTLDDNTFAVTLPFAFTYDSAPQTQIQVNTNGWIAFGGTSPGTTNYSPLSSTAVTPGFVAAFGRDLQGGFTFASTRTLGSNQVTAVSSNGPIQIGDVLVGAGIPAGTTVTAIAGNTLTMSANATATSTGTAVTAYGPWSDMRWDVQGTAPNRVFIAQWSNFKRFGTTLTTVQNMFLNFQVRLNENGTIETVYGDCTPGVTTLTTINQVGLRGPTNAFPANVNARLNVKGTSDWATSTPATANTSGQVFNNVAPANVIPNGLTYTWAPPVGVVATNTTLGTGCGAAGFNSFYANYADAALASAALSGNALSLNPTTGGYVGTWLPTAANALFVAPTAAATTLGVGDDGVVNVTPSIPLSTPFGPFATLQVSGNGIIGFGATPVMDYPGTNSFTPTAGGFLNSTLGGFYAWHDYNASEVGSGPVVSEEVGGTLYVTYNGVENYPTTVVNTGTLQFQLDLATGVTRIVWVSVDNNTTSTFGSAHLVGVSAPGASRDPGSVDLATAALVTTPEFNSLALTASNRPVQGAAASTWDLVLSNVQPTAVIGVDIFGISDPGILDLGLFGLGQAGCQLRANLDVANAWLASGSTHNYSLTIPPSPSLNNFVIFTQSAILGNGSSSDNTTSNGIQGTVGNL